MAHTPVDERRRALLAATMRVVASRGLAAASTRAIVAEAGMALASFHYAFDSRDDLLEVLMSEVVALEERAIAPTSVDGKTLTELLHDGLLGYLRHLQSDPSHEQAMLELTQYAIREKRELARDQYAAYTHMVTDALDIGARVTGTHWLVPLPAVTRLLITLTDGLTMTWLVDRDDALAEQVVAAAARAVAALAADDDQGAEPRADDAKAKRVPRDE